MLQCCTLAIYAMVMMIINNSKTFHSALGTQWWAFFLAFRCVCCVQSATKTESVHSWRSVVPHSLSYVSVVLLCEFNLKLLKHNEMNGKLFHLWGIFLIVFMSDALASWIEFLGVFSIFENIIGAKTWCWELEWNEEWDLRFVISNYTVLDPVRNEWWKFHMKNIGKLLMKIEAKGKVHHFHKNLISIPSWVLVFISS